MSSQDDCLNVELIPKVADVIFLPKRYLFLRGGRGSGKSWTVARALITLAFQDQHRILCTREVQKSIKQSVHQLLRDQIVAMGLSGFFTVLEHEIRGLNGSAFFFSGLSDQTSDSIKSFEGCTRVWCEEAQSITRRSWRILTPTIRAPGSEIWATYNPELESDETHQMAVINPSPDTISLEVNFNDNPWFPEVLDKERAHAEKTMRPEDYAHIWGGQCRPAVEGAIYFDSMSASLAAGRIREVPHDASLKTHVVFDLGMADSMTLVLVQKVASEIRIIHYIEGNQRILADYSAELRGLRLDDQPMNWGNVYLPHDGFHTRHQTGKDDATIMRGLGWDVMQVPNTHVSSGIDRAREVFPRIYFNKTRTERLVECLKRYRWNIVAKTGEAVAPLHDEFSHGADAFRYLCLVEGDLSNETWGSKLAYPRLVTN
jgi:phage terminase large subunit